MDIASIKVVITIIARIVVEMPPEEPVFEVLVGIAVVDVPLAVEE